MCVRESVWERGEGDGLVDISPEMVLSNGDHIERRNPKERRPHWEAAIHAKERGLLKWRNVFEFQLLC